MTRDKKIINLLNANAKIRSAFTNQNKIKQQAHD